ncbi:MAG: FG-GAP-like repeat-containing protein [Reichenbachiella sp.]|uniref:FG-GAP-like repeat-containing protein n=1 Tax=Reichenbachiella sp. TaxID=2184521 RepID=UPI003264D721
MKKRKLIGLLGVLCLTICEVVAQVPTITTFTPTSGPVGSGIILNGTNFDPTPANNEVFFGTAQATVTSATSTHLTIIVPPGASYERISVLVNGSIAMSTKPFEVTFESDGNIAEESFDTSELFETGMGPWESVTVDLDEDGLLDILVSNSMDDDISLLRNSSTGIGDINFEDRVDYQVGSSPSELVTADFDADGKLDVAVVNGGSGNISILRNTSSGSISFDAKVDFAAGSSPTSLAVSDVDGDGKVDIAVVDWDNDVVSILRNTSSGVGVISFATKVDFATGDQPSRVAIADIDLDLKPDLLVANASGSLSILLNTSSVGTSSFSTKQDYSLSGEPKHIVTSDFDEDGSIDIAVSSIATPMISGSQNKIELFRNTSSPGSLSFVRTDLSEKASWMSLSDINGDGKLDMFFSDLFNGFSILENESTVGSISFGDEVYIGTNIFTLSITSDNLDNDGEPDIILTGANLTDGSVLEIYRNLGSGASFGDFDVPSDALSTIANPNMILKSAGFESASVIELLAPAIIDPVNHTIDVTVADCTDPTALIFSFELSPGATAEVLGMSGSIPQISGVTANDFSIPVTYLISAEDGSNSQYWTVTVHADKFADNVNQDVQVCDDYTFDGAVLTASGQYQGMFTNQVGCDSLVTLNLTILSDNVVENIDSCESYEFDGMTLTTTGQYQGIFTNRHLCDSLVTLNLTIHSDDVVVENIDACDSYEFDGMTLTSSGQYQGMLTNTHGCDSLVTLNLVIHDPDILIENVVSCDSYEFDGNTLMSTGQYQGMFMNQFGCDSLVTLNLTINESDHVIEDVGVCDSYLFDGSTLTASGQYQGFFTNEVGCDSLVTLNLTIQSNNVVENASACDSYLFDGNVLTATGQYQGMFTNLQNCDSLVTLNLTINKSEEVETVIDACGDYQFGTQLLTESGEYNEVFTNQGGCDSLVALTFVQFTEPLAEVEVNGVVLIATEEIGGAYQWYDCDTEEVIEGEDQRQMTPPATGNYYVEISNGACTSTSECVFFDWVLSTTQPIVNQVRVYPTLTNGELTVDLQYPTNDVDIRVLSMDGTMLYNKSYGSFTSGTFQVQQPTGIYFLQVRAAGTIINTQRIIKK